jgi:hypothetical protein
MSYLSASDITDAVVSPFAATDATYFATVLTLADAALVDMAEGHGLSSTAIVTPLHTTVKDWLVAWFCTRVCMDKLQVANIDATAQDKYTLKYQLYSGIRDRLKHEITAQMLTKTVQYAQDRVTSVRRYS